MTAVFSQPQPVVAPGSIDADVVTIVEQVWETFLGVDDAQAVAVATGEPRDDAAQVWSSTVTITGDLNAIVTVTTGDAEAYGMAQTLFQVPVATMDDIADTFGELVNVIGGNVKTLLNGSGVLSLPVTARGAVAPESKAVEICRVEASYAGHLVAVTVRVIPPRGALS